MTVLLPVDDVLLFDSEGERDSHGWALPGATAVWEGRGNLQLQPGRSDPRAAEGGGHGPHDPERDHVGILYLPADAELRDGMTAVVRGEAYALGQTRLVLDPTGGPFDCWVATATGFGDWHGDDDADG